MSKVRVKICGLTTPEDAAVAIEAGADALGFNTWTGSLRHLDLEDAAPWLRALPPFVTKVALLVNASLEQALKAGRLPFIDAVQLHGDEDPAYCRELLAALGRPLIKALRVRSVEDLAVAAAYPRGTHFLLDAQVPGAYGGTGVSIDPALVAEFRRLHLGTAPILAGGLRPTNVAAAVQAARPYAVDVSSGVEDPGEPRRKNPALVRAFLEAVRSVE